MNKYQEALDNYSENVDYRDYSTKTVDIVNESYDALQELVDQTKTSTIEEIKQDWEEEGFEVICSKERFEAYKQWIERRQKVSYHTSAKVVIEKDFFYIVGQFSNKYTHILTITFRALGWFDE